MKHFFEQVLEPFQSQESTHCPHGNFIEDMQFCPKCQGLEIPQGVVIPFFEEKLSSEESKEILQRINDARISFTLNDLREGIRLDPFGEESVLSQELQDFLKDFFDNEFIAYVKYREGLLKDEAKSKDDNDIKYQDFIDLIDQELLVIKKELEGGQIELESEEYLDWRKRENDFYNSDAYLAWKNMKKSQSEQFLKSQKSLK